MDACCKTLCLCLIGENSQAHTAMPVARRNEDGGVVFLQTGLFNMFGTIGIGGQTAMNDVVFSLFEGDVPHIVDVERLQHRLWLRLLYLFDKGVTLLQQRIWLYNIIILIIRYFRKRFCIFHRLYR